MVRTLIRDYGTSVIASSDGDEEIIPALGNGVAIPGDLVSIASTRKVAGSDVGANEEFAGILMESQITGTETAIGDGVPCDVVVPISGHRYRIRMLDPGADFEMGYALTFSATAGKADVAADIIHALCTAAKPVYDTETVAEVFWL
jgi:hypothetical protein